MEWPEAKPTIEEMFLNAEELPVYIPEPKLQPESKLLRVHHKGKTLRELIRKKVKV